MRKQSEPHKHRKKQFMKARADFEETIDDIAENFGYSRQRIYDVLKYPNENPDLFRKIADYVKKAGYPFDEKPIATKK